MQKIFSFTMLIMIGIVLYANNPIPFTEKKYNEMVAKSNISTFQTYKVNNYRYAVFTENDQKKYFIVSTDYSDVKGYQGTTTLGIVLNEDMTVDRVNIIKSQETHAYVKRIISMGFLQRLAGYHSDLEVEIVSGATSSCKAIIQSIDECIVKFSDVLN